MKKKPWKKDATRNYTFKAWQENSDHDEHSVFIPLDYNSNSLILVNKEMNEKTFTLKKGLIYKTLDGESIKNQVTIPGFESMILIY